MKYSPIMVVGIAISAIGFARAETPATAGQPACLIAGWENPASVCVSHNRTIAATCYICHGPNGISQGAVPGLAGQDKDYLITAMKEFRDGKRESSVMKKYAMGYSDSEYEALAVHFSSIKPKSGEAK